MVMKKILWLIFWVSIFLLFLLPANDPDLGWQLRCGKMFWEGGGICKTNTFTVLMEGYSWVNHAWLYQVLIYPVFRIFGVAGLVVMNALIMTGTCGLFFLYLRKFGSLARLMGVLVFVFMGWGIFSLGIRSQILALFILSVDLYLLTRKKLKFRWWWIIFLTGLFVNFHGSFVVALVVNVSVLICEVWRNKQDRKWGILILMGLWG